MTTEIATTETKMTALKNRVTTTPEFENWKPSAGETLIGEIVGGDIFKHPLYGEQKVMKVRAEGGACINVFLNKWLMNALESFAATTGDFIALTFKGKKKTLLRMKSSQKLMTHLLMMLNPKLLKLSQLLKTKQDR
jgi:hypothetical protein